MRRRLLSAAIWEGERHYQPEGNSKNLPGMHHRLGLAVEWKCSKVGVADNNGYLIQRYHRLAISRLSLIINTSLKRLCEPSEDSVATGQFKLSKFAGWEGGSHLFQGSVNSRRPRSSLRGFIVASISQCNLGLRLE